MKYTNSRLISSLDEADGSFLQVLLHEFTLVRSDGGTRLEVVIQNDSPAIHQSEAKAAVKAMISDFAPVADVYQRRLEEFLMGHSADTSLAFRDDNFAFRYASGGVLPIVQIEGQDYYCLFYRDLEPVGWNIANGATDTREELLRPEITIEREFCEELMIVDDANGYLYRFDVEHAQIESSASSREHWRATVGGRTGGTLTDRKLEVHWIDGPDSLSVTVQRDQSGVRECFLNINALDFGIEVDRVARILLHDRITLCDGELVGTAQINRPIGLFAAERLNERVAAGLRRFEPDILFHDGVRLEGVPLDEVIFNRFLRDLFQVRTRRERDVHGLATERGLQYDLCPVTRSIIRRFVAH